MKWAIIAVAAVTVSGCTKSVSEMSYTELKQYTASLVKRCEMQGVPQAELKDCVRQEFSADYTRRMKQEEIATAIAGASADYSRSVQANRSRAVRCTSTGNGYTVTTTCR